MGKTLTTSVFASLLSYMHTTTSPFLSPPFPYTCKTDQYLSVFSRTTSYNFSRLAKKKTISRTFQRCEIPGEPLPTFADFTADVEHPALDTPLWKFGAVNNAAAQPPVTLTMPPTPVIVVVRHFRVASIFPRTHADTYAVQTAATNVRNLPSPASAPVLTSWKPYATRCQFQKLT